MSDLAEFGVVQEECYFCGQLRTIRFNEHYTFCPNCSAIYTFFILVDSNCEHVSNNTPAVIREPWYYRGPERPIKPYIYEGKVLSYGQIRKVQKCSVCNKKCIADGW